MSILIRLPGREAIEVSDGSLTVGEAIAQVDEGVARQAQSARVDGELVDLTYHPPDGATIEPVLPSTAKDLGPYRHSLAHLLAAAVLELWPDTKQAIGPAIENGFYYDFDFSEPISEADLPRIEERMRAILPTWTTFERIEVTPEEAEKEFTDNPYKLELIREFATKGERLTLYKSGNYVDLCRGGHVENARQIKPDTFKLSHLAGAYWRGNEKNPMLTRIYGLAFATKGELDRYIAQRAEAEKRDHKKLGAQLRLFMFHPFAPASPFFFPRGAVIYNTLIDYVRELYQKYGYEEVITPLIYEAGLWRISGHYEHFWDDMFRIEADEREYAPKPMNCPSHCLMYAANLHSYRDLPIRYADFARLHRYERSGATTGLTRVRSFSQDDAHIFCRPDQIQQEVHNFLEMLTQTYKMLGFEDVKVYLSTRPPKRAGTDEIWDRAETTLAEVLGALKVQYTVAPGEGAFYGPKVDFNVKDAVGRPWQLGTVQLDFNLPERFRLEYVTEAGTIERPVMIHRAMFGSIERFLGVYIEHCAGAFPMWLAPVQAIVLPITNKQNEYAQHVYQRLLEAGLRAESDLRNDKVGAKIRDAQLQKIPFMLVVGAREAGRGEVSVRERHRGDTGAVPVDAFIQRALHLIRTRAVGLESQETSQEPPPEAAGSKER
ncbi:MAG: threonine--tRNA ligase [Acidobacteria bacterium]|nr:threonine--tRNA ligase [Acidobacteriota bacterium]